MGDLRSTGEASRSERDCRPTAVAVIRVSALGRPAPAQTGVLRQTCAALAQQRLPCETVSDRAAAKGRVDGGTLVVGDHAFGCVVVPGATRVPLDLFRTLCRFAVAGGCLAFVEPAPMFGSSPQETEAIAALWPGLLDAKRVARVATADGLPVVIRRWLT